MEYKAEGVIVKEKEHGGTMHILLEGNVEVRKKMAGGKDKPLAVLGEGDVFGEMSLFDERQYSASVVARENSSTLTITGKDFLEMAEAEPKLVMKVTVNLINTLSERLRKTNENLVAIASLRSSE
jgi:CRP-like cAMP-binding protein